VLTKLLFNGICNRRLIYNIIGLIGYYIAAALVDRPWMGRRRLQMISFTALTIIFFVTGAVFESASSSVLIMLYFLSNIAATAGAETTVKIMSAESFPAEVKGTCYGLSAFLGKAGATFATILFGLVNTVDIFWICGALSAAGILFTFIFSNDMTHVSLAEHDAQLELFLEGRLNAYKGRLNSAAQLSNYELWTGRHGEYDPSWARKLIQEEKDKLVATNQ